MILSTCLSTSMWQSESASESASDDDVFMTDNDDDEGDSDGPLNPARIFIPLMGERRHQLRPLTLSHCLCTGAFFRCRSHDLSLAFEDTVKETFSHPLAFASPRQGLSDSIRHAEQAL